MERATRMDMSCLMINNLCKYRGDAKTIARWAVEPCLLWKGWINKPAGTNRLLLWLAYKTLQSMSPRQDNLSKKVTTAHSELVPLGRRTVHTHRLRNYLDAFYMERLNVAGQLGGVCRGGEGGEHAAYLSTVPASLTFSGDSQILRTSTYSSLKNNCPWNRRDQKTVW